MIMGHSSDDDIETLCSFSRQTCMKMAARRFVIQENYRIVMIRATQGTCHDFGKTRIACKKNPGIPKGWIARQDSNL